MRLPHFPLHSVTFPHLPLPLRIFEERYRAMTEDLVRDGSPWDGRFVVAKIIEGPEVGGDAAAEDVGTVCDVRSAERLADGGWVLLAVGIGRARIVDVDRSGRYAVAEVDILPEPPGQAAAELLPSVQRALDSYLVGVKRFVAHAASVASDSQDILTVAASLDEVLKPIRLPEDPAAASYAVGGVLQIELTRKQRLLELPDAASRLRAELRLLRDESRLLTEGSLPPLPAGDIGYHPN